MTKEKMFICQKSGCRTKIPYKQKFCMPHRDGAVRKTFSTATECFFAIQEKIHSDLTSLSLSEREEFLDALEQSIRSLRKALCQPT